MLVAILIFSRWNWLWVVAGVLAVTLLLLFWGYRRLPGGRLRWICATLKALGVAALGLCLLEPTWLGQRARPGANLLAIVADNTQSLQVNDPGQRASRGEVLRELLDPQKRSWQASLEDNFEVRRFSFDSRLQSAKEFTELNFDGRSSGLGSALRTLKERFGGRPLAGIVLLTDGNATDARGIPQDMEGLPPVYPVVIGGSEPIRDIALQETRVTQAVFEDAPVQVQADVTATGYQGDTVVAQLLDPSGKKVAEQVLSARRETDRLTFRFHLRPDKPGLCFYRIRVGTKAEMTATADTQKTKEATLANNAQVMVVDRRRGPYRVLYVAGRPNWEFKFLNRALQEDQEIELVGLIRAANREPKFNFLGRAGETSNPLFRGFDAQGQEEVERYDQPVLVRLNTRDEFELRSGFPSKPEDLYSYHAVILDDLEAGFFSPDQALLLQKFVSERGGGFLMLGGMESFQQGKYQRTPIGDMLPVYLDRAEAAHPPGPLRLDLTREGMLQPWARLRDNEADERSRLADMPALQVLNRIREVKPGASVVATVKDEAGHSYPALVVQRFGRGRSAALTVGDVWRWGFRDAEAHRDMDKAWRQWVRSLIADVPNRVELAIEPAPNEAAGTVQLQVRVRDAKFHPVDDAAVSLEIQPVLMEEVGAATNVLRFKAEASSREAGLYQASFFPRLSGGYRVTAIVMDTVGTAIGRAEGGWSTDLAAEEFKTLTPNLALLETLATKTGGEVVSANRLEEFALSLPHRQAPVMDAWSFPVWHTPAMFVVALSCLLAEWGLRRWKGVP
jgi:uncharacterized membrane protein